MGTITKALTLLNHFTDAMPEITLAQFKRLSEQDKATVYRHLSELEENGFLEQNPATKGYRLGPAVLKLSAIRERTFPIRSVVSKWIDELSGELAELVHVSLLQGDVMCPIYHANLHTHGTTVQFDEAETLPLHATSSGITMLAFGPAELMESILNSPLEAHTPHTVVERKSLIELVKLTKQRGYSYGNQGFEIDVHSVAVPIFNVNMAAIGTIAVALPTSRMNETMEERIITSLMNTSMNVSRALGGSIPSELKQLWNKAA